MNNNELLNKTEASKLKTYIWYNDGSYSYIDELNCKYDISSEWIVQKITKYIKKKDKLGKMIKVFSKNKAKTISSYKENKDWSFSYKNFDDWFTYHCYRNWKLWCIDLYIHNKNILW